MTRSGVLPVSNSDVNRKLVAWGCHSLKRAELAQGAEGGPHLG